MRVSIKEINDLCVNILIKKGLSKEDSQTIVDEYIYAERAGIKTHGLSSFKKWIVDKISKFEELKIVKEDKSYALIDGKGNFGQVVGKKAINLGIKKAKETGISIIGMFNMLSYLMPGYYSKIASKQNMIAICIDNSRSRAAPYGGIDPKLGANPIGLSLPTKSDFTIDMATSTKAMGEVRLAEKFNKKLPEGLALDKDGNPTLDPKEFNALTIFGGHKGYALNLAIEILAGTLVNAKMGSEIKKGLDRGFMFIVINPEIFTSLNKFQDESEKLFKEVKSSRKAKGFEEILIPGEKESRKLKENQEFLELEKSVLDEIKSLL